MTDTTEWKKPPDGTEQPRRTVEAANRVTAFLTAFGARNPELEEVCREFDGDDRTRACDLLTSDLWELVSNAHAQLVVGVMSKLRAITPVPHGTLFVVPGETEDSSVATLMSILTALNGHGGFALLRVDEHDEPKLLPEERMNALGWFRKPF